MIGKRPVLKVFFAVVCGFFLLAVPVTFAAQLGGVVQGTKRVVKKGAEATEKGVETAAEKTKECAEAVGRGVKKAVTGDDDDDSRYKSEDYNSRTGTRTSGITTQTSPTHLPATAGELSLLALTGTLALTAAAASTAIRKRRRMFARNR